MHNSGGQAPATRLREFRAVLMRRGLSLEALGRAVKLDASHVRRVVLGERPASRRFLRALYVVLGDDARAFFDRKQ